MASPGGPGRRIFSRGALLLRGGRKGDPDTKSGLGTKIYFALMREARRKFYFALNFLCPKSLCTSVAFSENP